MKPFVLGIAGGSGSGKSSLVERLRTGRHGGGLALLPHDAYYRDPAHMPESIRGQDNWDHPDALDNTLYVEHLDALLAGRTVSRPVYDFTRHRRSDRVEVVEPRAVVLLEGILLLAIAAIRERIDLRVYVDTPAEERIVRRLLRDVTERERTVESVAEQFRATVRPMHDRFVEPSRAHAHLIVPWDWQGDPEPAIAALEARLGVALAGARAASAP